jgi:hypothetical protein
MSHTPIGCAADDIGVLSNGNKVRAITDDMGAQVVVTGDNCLLLSQPLANHESAKMLAHAVVDADSIDFYPKWINGSGEGNSLMAILACLQLNKKLKINSRTI